MIPGPEKGTGYPLQNSWASLVAQSVKKLPAVRETWVGSLASEDPLGNGLTTHSGILAWRLPQTGEPSRLTPWSHEKSVKAEQLSIAQHRPINRFLWTFF